MRVLLPLAAVGAAYLAALAAERLFDLGVIAALVIAAAALVALMWRTGDPACPDRQDCLSSTLLIAMPLVGWTHADPEWRRTTVILYLIFAAASFVCGVLTRKRAMFVAGVIALVIAWSTGNPPLVETPPASDRRLAAVSSRKNVPRATFCVQSPSHYYL